jgi:hypothetical protein
MRSEVSNGNGDDIIEWVVTKVYVVGHFWQGDAAHCWLGVRYGRCDGALLNDNVGLW